MNIYFKILQVYTPDFLKKYKLKQLCHIVGDVFKQKSPDFNGLSYCQSLNRFAQFSRWCAESTDDQQDVFEIKNKLFEQSYAFGVQLKEQFGIKNKTQALKVFSYLYGLMGIQMQSDGVFLIIDKCYFSPFYNPRICHIMSSLDTGIFMGLSGGLKPEFKKRITDGEAYCLAQISIQS